MRFRAHWTYTCFCLLILSLNGQTKPILAQEVAACLDDTPTMLQQVGTQCADLAPGAICLGSGEVTVEWQDGVEAVDFAAAGDRAAVQDIATLQSSAFDHATGEWGIAVMNVQANLPSALPGRGAVYVALGNVRIEEATPLENRLIPPQEGVEVTARAGGADLLVAPPGMEPPALALAQANPAAPPAQAAAPDDMLLVQAAAGTSLIADALSPDREWLRVFFLNEGDFGQTTTAWVARSQVTSAPGLALLPEWTPGRFTPMQSFFLQTGPDEGACAEEVPSMLYVQGPEETETDLLINGAPVRLSSSMLVRTLNGGTILQIIALSGIVRINPGSPDEVLILPGFVSEIALGPALPPNSIRRLIAPRAVWTIPVVLPAEVLERLFALLDGNIPESLQYYRTYVPRLVCPSGVGQVICRIQLRYVRLIQRLQRLCQRGVLPAPLCERFDLR